MIVGGELFYLTGQTVHIPSVRCTLNEPKDLAAQTTKCATVFKLSTRYNLLTTIIKYRAHLLV